MDDAPQNTQHDHQQLGIYRRNVQHLTQQATKFGGEAHLPTHLMNELYDARTAIAALKARLCAQGVTVANEPDDEPPAQADARRAQALLDAMPIDVVPELASFPAFSRMPYAANPHFVGRDDVFLALAQALKGGGRVALGSRAAATGLGGIGKTSVAAEFVHRYGQYFAGGVFWLSCADPAAVSGEVAACGGVGFLDLRPTFADLKQDEQVVLVTAAWRQEIPRLLVFDNCEDPKLVETWAPTTGGCRVLITSRRQRWPSGLRVQTQRLAVLARQSSIALLQELAPRLTTAEADAIATELGDLPLALQLAGSYLAQFERTRVSTYLAELSSDVILKHPSLQGIHDADVSLTAHDRHVGRTVLVSYQRLNPTDPTDALAIRLLARAACLAPGEPIPLDLLLATAGLDAEAPDGQTASQRLIDLGFLTSEADDTVKLHRLIHAFVGAVVMDTAALGGVEQVVTACAKDINDAGYPSAMQPLVSHLRWLTHQADTREDSGMATLCANVGYHLRATGDYAGARPLFERALVIWEQALGPDHPTTARSLNNLAGLLESTGDYAGARPLLERALAIREQALGPDHPDTANSLNNLAGLLHAMGDYAGARPLMERALVIWEQELGPDHPDTASSLNNLAGLLRATGDYAGARPLFERALAIWEQALGPDHPDTARSLNNLAALLESTGDYAGARPLYERALAVREQALGPDHPDTASSLNNLAGLLAISGDYAGARPLFERALAITQQALGPDHPDTASSLNNLAYLLHAMGDYTGARPLFERALAITQQELGPDHPDTASSLNNLAYLLHAMGDYAGARPLLERALAIWEQALGPDHPDTARSLNNLASLLDSTGDYAGARPLLERALAIWEQALGPDHPDTASSLNNLAYLLQAIGDYTGARPLFERALAIYEQALGPDHPNTGMIRDNLADLDAAQRAPGDDQEHPTAASDPDHDDAPPQD